MVAEASRQGGSQGRQIRHSPDHQLQQESCIRRLRHGRGVLAFKFHRTRLLRKTAPSSLLRWQLTNSGCGCSGVATSRESRATRTGIFPSQTLRNASAQLASSSHPAMRMAVEQLKSEPHRQIAHRRYDGSLRGLQIRSGLRQCGQTCNTVSSLLSCPHPSFFIPGSVVTMCAGLLPNHNVSFVYIPLLTQQ